MNMTVGYGNGESVILLSPKPRIPEFFTRCEVRKTYLDEASRAIGQVEL